MQSELLLQIPDYPKKCSACAKRKDGKERNQTFPSADSLWAHISTAHSLWIPYECVLCPMMFLPTEGLLQQHYEKTHPESVPKAIYTYVAKKKKEIERIFLESQKPLDTNRSDEKCSYVRPNLEGEPAFVQCSNNAEINQIGTVVLKEKETDKCLSDTEEEEEEEIEQSLPRNISDTEEEEEIALEIEKEENELNQEISGTDKGTVDDLEASFEHDSENMEADQPNSNLEEGEEDTSGIGDEEQANIDAETKRSKHKTDNPSRHPRLESDNKCCNLCQATIGPTTDKGRHIWSDHMGTSRRFHCKDCAYKTSTTTRTKAHSEQVHNNMPSRNGWVDNTAALTPQYERQYELAFGCKSKMRQLRHPLSLPQSTGVKPPSQTKPPKIQCQLCGKTVVASKRHVWSHHMDRYRYTCRRLICDYGTGSNVFEMRKHVRATGHGNADDECCWKDNTQALSDEFEQKHMAAYGRSSRRRPKEENELNQEISWTEDDRVEDLEASFERRGEKMMESHQPNSNLEGGEEDTLGVEDEQATLDAETKSSKQKIGKKSRQPSLRSDNAWCSLCEATIAPKRPSVHIWSNHMGTSRRFHCKACMYKTSTTSQTKSHSQRVHKIPSENGWVDNTAALTPQYERQYELAFGCKSKISPLRHLSTVSQSSVVRPPSLIRKQTKPPTIQCQLCGKSADSSKRHVWIHHMNRYRYTCRRLICDYGTSSNVLDMRQHVRKTGHGNADDECCWKDNTQALSDEFEQKHMAAYGRASSRRRK